MDRIVPNPLPICTTNIGVAQCHLEDDRDIDLNEAWPLLSAQEAARARRFHFDRDRIRYVRGRGFLRHMLAQVSGQDPARLVFGTGACGKPFLQDSPVAFSLSHSRDLAVVAIARTGSIGLDIEFIDPRADIAALAQSCLTQAETAVLQALPEAARRACFFGFWTAKEARMKLTGEGMSLPPHQIALDLRDGRPVGYLHPKAPAAQALFLDLGIPSALCCLALAQGPKASIQPLGMKRAIHVTPCQSPAWNAPQNRRVMKNEGRRGASDHPEREHLKKCI